MVKFWSRIRNLSDSNKSNKICIKSRILAFTWDWRKSLLAHSFLDKTYRESLKQNHSFHFLSFDKLFPFREEQGSFVDSSLTAALDSGCGDVRAWFLDVPFRGDLAFPCSCGKVWRGRSWSTLRLYYVFLFFVWEGRCLVRGPIRTFLSLKPKCQIESRFPLNTKFDHIYEEKQKFVTQPGECIYNF